MDSCLTAWKHGSKPISHFLKATKARRWKIPTTRYCQLVAKYWHLSQTGDGINGRYANHAFSLSFKLSFGMFFIRIFFSGDESCIACPVLREAVLFIPFFWAATHAGLIRYNPWRIWYLLTNYFLSLSRLRFVCETPFAMTFLRGFSVDFPSFTRFFR